MLNLSCGSKFEFSNSESEIAKSASRCECVVSSRIEPALFVAEDRIEDGVEDKIEPIEIGQKIINRTYIPSGTD